MITYQDVDRHLDTLFKGIHFKQEPCGLYDPLRYMISIGGKRIRPRLCLLSYSLYKDEISDSILQPVAALEVFHSFTLLHDDIMDKSDKRRGKLTVWKKWNEDTAILSGDVMSIDSYRRLSFVPREIMPDVLDLFSKTAAQVCEGQQYDMDFESRREVTMDEYMKMIGLKTAVLIACSAKMGAIIGGASESDCEKLYRYGYDLGLAFQIADDYLDAYGNEEVFGKPIGGDILNCKKSWLLTRATEKISDRQRLFDAMAMSSNDPQIKIAAVKSIYEELDIANDAKKEIKRLTDNALSYIKDIDRNDILKSFAASLVGRAC